MAAAWVCRTPTGARCPVAATADFGATSASLASAVTNAASMMSVV